jgi:hypothetical protein
MRRWIYRAIKRLFDDSCLRAAEFAFWLWLLGAFSAFDVLLICLENDMIIKSVPIEVFLFA